MENKNLLKCLETAKAFGSPVDQVKNFVEHGHIPFPWQWEFHSIARQADKSDGPVDIGVGGARGPGKSHAVLAQAGLDDCQRVRGLKGLFLRQTGIAAQESFDDLVEKVLRGRIEYKKTGSLLRFDNDSKILLGGFRVENDIDKYVGIEYDFIIVEELNQLTEEKYTKLRGSLRTSKPNWRPRMYTSFNPGGIGHSHVKSRYIMPNRNHEEVETRFVGATYKDNPCLNKEYIDYLEGLSGDLGKAWREGEWDLFAGQVFTDWRQDRHVINEFAIPPEWNRWISMDWGVNAPFCVLWFVEGYDKRMFAVRELYMNGVDFEKVMGVGLTPKKLAQTIQVINKKMGWEDYQYLVADPACWNHPEGGESIAETMMGTGLKMIAADNERILGLARVREALSQAPDGKPYLQFFRSCRKAIETIPALSYDERKRTMEDVNSDLEDHAYDSLRYFLMSRPSRTTTLPNPVTNLLSYDYKKKTSGFQEEGETVLEM
ncbi:phage terminase large subunit [Patescibacteria group bacterium]|nr:phage terminase large subunit [Patescibacteria group bacterium]